MCLDTGNKNMSSKEQTNPRKNKNFTQVYPKGWDRVMSLIGVSPGAAKLYSFLAQNIDSSCGAVVCDRAFLAKKMGSSVRTVARWIACLEEQKAITKIKINTTISAYALNPHEVWKGYNTSKDYAAFNTKTLVDIDGEVKKKLRIMMCPEGEEEQLEMFDEPH